MDTSRTSWMRKLAHKAVVGIAIAASCTGCASLGPKPWQKDLMARKEMQIDSHPLLTAAQDHVYFSKEASSGGRGFAGGGCGCN